MRLSNFELIGTKGTSALDREYFAMVDVQTGLPFFRKTERRQIRKANLYWHFVDTGKWTPENQAEELARAWEAQGKGKC